MPSCGRGGAEPADPTHLGRHALPVRWRVATDDSMRRVVASGVARAEANLAHSVHVEVDCLRLAATTSTSSTLATRRARSAISAPHRLVTSRPVS